MFVPSARTMNSTTQLLTTIDFRLPVARTEMATAPSSSDARHWMHSHRDLLPLKLVLIKERPHLSRCVDVAAIPPDHPFQHYPLATGPLWPSP